MNTYRGWSDSISVAIDTRKTCVVKLKDSGCAQKLLTILDTIINIIGVNYKKYVYKFFGVN